MNNETPLQENAAQAVNSNQSLLEELDKLEVVEAKELQEGIAFHAFRFAL